LLQIRHTEGGQVPPRRTSLHPVAKATIKALKCFYPLPSPGEQSAIRKAGKPKPCRVMRGVIEDLATKTNRIGIGRDGRKF